jgi:hypothetical protein
MEKKEPNLLAKVKSDLEKSGFASEMKAIRILADNNWNGSGGQTYFDLDKEISREFDFSACRFSTHNLSPETSFTVGFRLYGEVKKSIKPWVVFERPAGKWSIHTRGSLVTSQYLPYDQSEFRRHFYRSAPQAKLGWVGYAIHECFKKPSHDSASYKALTTSCKAAFYWWQFETDEFFSDHEKRKETTDPCKYPPEVLYIQPVVILDGLLLSAKLDEKEEILLKHIDHATVSFNFKTSKYKKGNYLVDIVTLTGLLDYIKQLEHQQNNYSEHLLSIIRTNTLE